MKKTLLSLAVLAVSGSALAQSSVTLYGTADAAMGKVLGGKVGMRTGSIVNTSDSFLGFRGTEDLGGGLKAGFQFEQGIDLRDGSNDTQPGFLTRTAYQRAANVWLGGNWGTLRLGRAYTPSRNAVAAWDLAGMARNSIILHTFGGPGEADERNSSQLSYKTPDFGGFAAELGYVLKPDNGDRTKVDLGLTYVNGPLSAGVSYNKTKGLKANYAAGAQYRFGMFALAAGYHQGANGVYYPDDATTAPIAAGTALARGFSLGGKAHFGAASLLVNVAREIKSEYNLNGVSHKGRKLTNGVVEGRYAFSKRTFVYANYARYIGTNNYAVGMRHDF